LLRQHKLISKPIFAYNTSYVFRLSSTAILRKTTLKCKVIKVTLHRVSIQCRSEISVLQRYIIYVV